MSEQQVTHLNNLSLDFVVDKTFASKNINSSHAGYFFMLLLSSAADFF